MRAPSGYCPVKRLLTTGDLMVIGILFLLSLSGLPLLWRRPGSGRSCVVSSAAGRAVISLSRDTSLVLTGPVGSTTVEIRDGRARISDSDCRHRRCVRMGWVKQPGEIAVCLPNRVVVEIADEHGEGVDAITR